MGNSIYHSQTICNRLKELSLYQSFTYRVIKHIMAILIGMMTIGYRGKTVDFARNSPHHRTTIAHFLNHGKWDEEKLEPESVEFKLKKYTLNEFPIGEMCKRD